MQHISQLSPKNDQPDSCLKSIRVCALMDIHLMKLGHAKFDPVSLLDTYWTYT